MRVFLPALALLVAAPAVPALAQYQDRNRDQDRYPQYTAPYQGQPTQNQQYQGQGQIPNGSYRQTCNAIQVFGNGNNARLTATCRDRQNRTRTSTLSYRLCRGDIVNDNGMLSCVGAPVATPGGGGGRDGYEQGQLPQGTWRNSCTDARIDRNMLTARCTDRSGRRVYAEANIRQCRAESFTNVDGRLVCDDGGRGRGRDGRDGDYEESYRLPGGSWTQTCTNGQIRNGYILDARCRTFVGNNTVVSSLDLRTCQRQQVRNQNGQLRCE